MLAALLLAVVVVAVAAPPAAAQSPAAVGCPEHIEGDGPLPGADRSRDVVRGALALLGAVLPGTRVAPGRFGRSSGLPMPRAGRVAMLVFGLAAVGLSLRCR